MRDLAPARLAMQDKNSDDPEIVSIRKVRRRLFDDGETSGNSDSSVNRPVEENKNYIEKAKERWNFDFIKGKPLKGRYQWKKVDKDGNEVEEPISEEEKEESTAGESDL